MFDEPTKSREANRILNDFNWIPYMGMSGKCIVALMRHYRVTIRHLASSTGITMKRIREVRNNGIKLDLRDSKRTVLVVMDWIEGIETAAHKDKS